MLSAEMGSYFALVDLSGCLGLHATVVPAAVVLEVRMPLARRLQLLERHWDIE